MQPKVLIVDDSGTSLMMAKMVLAHEAYDIVTARDGAEGVAKAVSHRPDLILLDVGPNLGAINRSALIAADFVAVPLGADLFSLQGLRNLGPTLRRWRGTSGSTTGAHQRSIFRPAP